MSNITWLHLSDFHFRTDKSPKGRVDDFNRDIVLDSLLDDLRTYPKDNGLTIDFIIVTGDIAFSGRADEYESAAEYLDKVRGIFALPKNRLFIVPGNHDVDRDKINPPLNLSNRDEITNVLSNKKAKALQFERFEGYRDFVNQYFGSELEFDYETRYFWARKFRLEKTGPEIGLLGLNSAWNACGNNDRNNLLIGEKQVRDAVKQVGEADLSIAAFHHPFDWLRDDDKKDIKRELAGKRYQLILHGHLHESGISCEATPDSSLVTIAAGACYEKRPYSNSYNFFTIDRKASQATLHMRRYSDSLGNWQADRETFHEAKNGICQIDLKRISPFGISPEPVVTLEVETSTAKLAPHFAHSKPLEEYWAGRKEELSRLSEWYGDEAVKVIGLVGFGGVGKSALARHWLEEADADGIFWWCFYHEPNLDAFLLAALDYVSGGQFDPKEVTGSPARVRTLLDYLTRGRFVFVLDGLEGMQNADDEGEHFGEMKAIIFTDLLRGWTERDHRSLAIITTRHRLKDLQSFEGQTYRRIFPEKLSPEDARELMRKRGVTGEDKALDKTTVDWNYHALSLKLIAGYLKEFYEGDISYVSEIPFSALKEDKKVNDILMAYDTKLVAAQKSFMSIFSVFRLPVEKNVFKPIFRDKIKPLNNKALAKINDFEFKRKIEHLVKLGLITKEKHVHKITYSTHPLIRRYYYESLNEETRIIIHRKIAQYYEKKAHQTPKTLDDLTYAIEAFHHTIQTRDYDKAFEIYLQKINIRDSVGNFLMTHNLGAFELDLNLVYQLFPDGDTSQDPIVTSANERGWLINEVGLMLRFLGRLEEATPFFQRCDQINLANNDLVNASICSGNLCEIHIKLGNLAEGETAALQALDWARGCENKKSECNSLTYLAYADFLQGKSDEGGKFFHQANVLERKIDSTQKWLYATRGILYAEFLYRSGEKDLAVEVTRANLEISQCEIWLPDIAGCYRLLAGFCLEDQNNSQAEKYLNEGLQIARNIGLQEEIARLHLGFARLYLGKKNELSKADSALKETLSICTRCGYKIIEIDARNVLAQVYQADDQPTLARTEARTAFDMSSQCGYYWGKLDAREILKGLNS